MAINPPGYMVRAQVSERYPERPAIWTMPDWAALAVVAGILAAAGGGFGAAVKPSLVWALLIVPGLIAAAIAIFTA